MPSTTTPDPTLEKIKALEDKIKQLLDSLPPGPLAEEQALKEAMQLHQQLAQAHTDELNKITSNGTTYDDDKVSEIYKHATGALLHNNGKSKINTSAKSTLKKLRTQKKNIDKQEAKNFIRLSTEASYELKVSGNTSIAHQIWNNGTTNSVYEHGVLTKFHTIQASNTTSDRLVMIFPGRSEPMVTY